MFQTNIMFTCQDETAPEYNFVRQGAIMRFATPTREPE
jgi:hypothetical protein